MNIPDKGASARAIDEIRKACRNTTTDRQELLLYAFDATRGVSVPDIVAFPVSTEEVSAIMKACTASKFPVTPRGAGTGFAGGAIPISGGAVISFARMDRILHLEKDALYVEVEPGVVNSNLKEWLEKEGLFYPPDPASLKSSTIGGNVSTGAGGPSAVKYGVTGDYVMGLTAVLPNGDVMETGIRTEKGAVGYNLTKLLVGSEGTLAVITKIRLKVLPLPESVVTAAAFFPERKMATKSAVEIIANRLRPRTLEYVDRTALETVASFTGAKIPPGTGAMLLLETDGPAAGAASEMISIGAICTGNGASAFVTAGTGEERESLWKIRRSISASLRKFRPTKINEDITVPRNRIADLMDRLDALSAETGIPIVNFGHAGDGNIHVNVMTDEENRDEYARALRAVDAIFDITLELGGTLSGEHGVGIAKKPYIAKELGANAIRVSKEIKKAFDPLNILNPGKIFPQAFPSAAEVERGDRM